MGTTIRGTFARQSPASFAEKTGIPMGWFVISHRWMPDKGERRKSHGRWFRIESKFGKTHRVLRFSPNLPGTPNQEGPAGSIVIDWVAWLDLNGYAEDVDGPLELRIERAEWWRFPVFAVSHPDPTTRLSGRIAVVSLGLGLLSIALAIGAFWG